MAWQYRLSSLRSEIFFVELGDKDKIIRVCPRSQKVFHFSLRQRDELTAIPESNRGLINYFQRVFVCGMMLMRRKLCLIAFKSDLRKKLAIYYLKYIAFEWITYPDHKKKRKQKFVDLPILKEINH